MNLVNEVMETTTYNRVEAYNIKELIRKEFGLYDRDLCVVGSVLICGKGNDIDILMYIENPKILEAAGFEEDLDNYYDSTLVSYRRGIVNIIQTADREFFTSEIATAYGAQAMNIYNLNMNYREDRITFHSYVRSSTSAYRLYPNHNHNKPLF